MPNNLPTPEKLRSLRPPVPFETYISLRITPDLVGYERELARIRAAIADVSHSYLIWITGAPGIGKTRLLRHILDQAGPGLCLASDPIDLGDNRTHSPAGFVHALLRVLGPLADLWQTEAGQRIGDPLQAAARAELEALPADEVAARQARLGRFFIRTINRFTSPACGRRVVLAVDNLDHICPGDARAIPALWGWLLRGLAALDNLIFLVAGRAAPDPCAVRLARRAGKRLLHLNLTGLDEAQAVAYFDAAARAAEPGDPDIAHIIRQLPIRDRRTVFYCLCDGQPPALTIRPLVLALAIDHLAVCWLPLAFLRVPPDAARRLSPDQRRSNQDQLGCELIRVIKNSRRSAADDVLLALGWLPMGADAGLIAHVTGLGRLQVEEAFALLGQTVLVRSRPVGGAPAPTSAEGQMPATVLTLHDEIVRILRRFALDFTPPPTRLDILKTIQAHTGRQVKAARQAIATLYAPATETDLPALEAALAARARLQAALVQQVYYGLRYLPDDGWQLYDRYIREAQATGDQGLALALRLVLSDFSTGRHEVSCPLPFDLQTEVKDTIQAELAAQAAINRVRRLVEHRRYQAALHVADRVRREMDGGAAAGNKLAQARLDVWHALALTGVGQHPAAQVLLARTIPCLERLRHSYWQAAGLAQVYHELGNVCAALGQYYGAIVLYTQALPLWRSTGLLPEHVGTLTALGLAKARVGMTAAAGRHTDDALKLCRRQGPRAPLVGALLTMACARQLGNDPLGALRDGESALHLAETLNSPSLRGPALLGLAQAERCVAQNNLRKAAKHLLRAIANAAEAVRLFEPGNAPACHVQALLEIGQACGDLARVRAADREDRPEADDVYALGQTALKAAIRLAHVHHLFDSLADAWVSLAWLHYAAGQLKRIDPALAHALALIPAAYDFPLRGKDRPAGPALDRAHIIVPFVIALGRVELLRAQLAFDAFENSRRRDLAMLQAATRHYALSLQHGRLFGAHIFGQVRRGLDCIYGRLKTLNAAEFSLVYAAVAQVELDYKLGKSCLRRCLEQTFGPADLLRSLP